MLQATSESRRGLRRVTGALAARWRSSPPVVALTVSALLLLLLYAAALGYLRPDSFGAELSLDALNRHAAAGEVRTAKFLDEDARITGTVTRTPGAQPSTFWTSYPRSDAATNDLLRALSSGGATVSVDSQSSKAIVRFVAQFLLPLVLMAEDKLLLSVGLNFLSIQQGYASDYGALFAAMTITMIPTLLVYIVFQRRLESGLTAGALKG